MSYSESYNAYQNKWDLACALECYNPNIDNLSDKIADFINAVIKDGKEQAETRWEESLKDSLHTKETTKLAAAVYKIDESAARRIIYKEIKARPHYFGNEEKNIARYKLKDAVFEGVKNKIITASEGFPEIIKNKIAMIYQEEIYRIIDETGKKVTNDAYWSTLRGLVDKYFYTTM